MMKVAYLTTIAFDANVSLIKELMNKCDVYFFTEAFSEANNYLNKEALSETITLGTKVDQIQRFSKMIPLEKTYVIKGVKQRNLFKKIYISYKINKILNEINPDVVLLDNHILTYFISAIKYRKKSLLIVHDPFFHSGENFLADRILRKLYFSFIDYKLLLNKNQTKDFINHYKQDPTKVFTSFLSVYEYLTSYHDENYKKDSNLNVLFFGRISPYKGVKFLLDAFVEILKDDGKKNITLTVAGSGNFDFDINPYYSYPQIRIINNYIMPEELSRLINEATIVVCPYTDATQSGVIMSSFAFKKPVIVTNVGGLPEMVNHNKTGIVIEPKNVKAIKEAILYSYDNPDVLKKMAVNIENEYFYGEKSWKHSANHFWNAIQIINNNFTYD
ncbi:glycosyltransferase family 4 protein [Chryseobacterium camelliae]|uniref:Glycosyltransferase family 4 protein n=1 Tax=Chryseobacterium camelliae TaxID=1265445 RepID=A0ABY7QPD9_9FLAO|nr:glycosyltransferase family 4 protein [Chryseobacterium camelliae]WBV61534.1 glycosyltransferase family 4 protein [Chryseobacterium camelliae]